MFRWSLSTDLNSTASHLAILLLRIGIALLLLTHGIPKLVMIITGNIHFPDPIGIGSTLTLILSTFAEVICPIFVFLGLGTRLSAIPPIIDLSVAAFIQHGADPIAVKEKALLYLLVFVVLLFTGAGRFSFDHKLHSRRFKR